MRGTYHPAGVFFTFSLCFLIAGAEARQAGQAGKADYFVSTAGNDSWSGGFPRPNATGSDGPFKSISRAQAAVRQEIAKGLRKNILVHLRGGTYQLAKTLRFNPSDSGSDQYSVTYAAYPGERPVVSGGKEIRGWQKKDGHVWSAAVPDVNQGWWFRQLVGNDKRLQRARYPNAGENLKIKEHGPFKGLRPGATGGDVEAVVLDRPFPGGDLAGKEAELVVYHLFSLSRTRIMDSEAESVRVYNTIGWIGLPFVSAAPGNLVHLEHSPEFLDQPGEWYLDRDTALVYYFAGDSEDPAGSRFAAPVISQLLVVAGTKDNPVRNLHFKGIHFEQTAWDLPLAGYNGIQAGHYGSRYIDQSTYALPLAIECTYLEDCSFEKMRLAHTGASGLGFGAGSMRNKVLGCEFYDIGGNAVMVGWRPVADEPPRRVFENDWRDPSDAPEGNEISHCVVRQAGTEQFDCVGIFVSFSKGTVIAHNLIKELPYTGISVGLTWNDFPTTQRGCRVEFNHVHDVMRVLHDGGGIYTLGYQPGTVVRNNLVHDVPNGHGMYTDEGSSRIMIENNVFYRLGEAGFNHHYGENNFVRNNVIASAKKASLSRGGKDLERSFAFERNIVWLNQGEVMRGNWANNLFLLDNNLYWDTRGQPIHFQKESLEQWKQRGHDVHSRVADPLFIDPEHGDFALKPGSPALEMGFKPIDLRRVGPQGEYRSLQSR